MKERHELLQMLHLSTGIPVYILNDKCNIQVSYPDIQLPKVAKYLIEQFHENGCDISHPLFLCENPVYFFALAQVSENAYVLLGPAGPMRYNKNALRESIRETAYAADMETILNILEFGPNVSMQNMVNTLRLAVHVIIGNVIATEHICMRFQEQRQINIGPHLVQNQFQEMEEQRLHTPKSYEDILHKSIENGDPSVFKEYQLKPVPGAIGRMSFNPEQQKRYEFVVSMTLFSRAAMRGGLDAETALSISDAFCQEMDSLPAPVDTTQLQVSAIHVFIEKVREVKQADTHYSPAIAACRRFITNNVQNKIQLSDIANYCGLSPSWLSKKFEAEVGVSIPDYIHEKRLEHACHLLQYTSFSICEISNILQYCTQSYFTEKFKERYHMTPKKFRDTHAL